MITNRPLYSVDNSHKGILPGIYVLMDGCIRHIPNPGILLYLFSSEEAYKKYTPYDPATSSYEVGNPLPGDASLSLISHLPVSPPNSIPSKIEYGLYIMDRAGEDMPSVPRFISTDTFDQMGISHTNHQLYYTHFPSGTNPVGPPVWTVHSDVPKAAYLEDVLNHTRNNTEEIQEFIKNVQAQIEKVKSLLEKSQDIDSKLEKLDKLLTKVTGMLRTVKIIPPIRTAADRGLTVLKGPQQLVNKTSATSKRLQKVVEPTLKALEDVSVGLVGLESVLTKTYTTETTLLMAVTGVIKSIHDLPQGQIRECITTKFEAACQEITPEIIGFNKVQIRILKIIAEINQKVNDMTEWLDKLTDFDASLEELCEWLLNLETPLNVFESILKQKIDLPNFPVPQFGIPLVEMESFSFTIEEILKAPADILEPVLKALEEILQKTIYDNLPTLNIDLPGLPPLEVFNQLVPQIEGIQINLSNPLHLVLIKMPEFKGFYTNMTIELPKMDFKKFRYQCENH